MIVATAGHIDHGKTTLVRALTGVDTDRLPEEKVRGISIDLGFAYRPLDNGNLIGFVDVPGHERFVRNMVAGVCGIDFALLVVAADDGIMPQTLEHLSILGILDVSRGAVAVTKIDRADETRVASVVNDVRNVLAGTKLACVPILPISSKSGAGVAELSDLLEREAVASQPREFEGQHFRLAIDRVFAIPGSGTIVTGTVFNGEAKVGDEFMLSPAGIPVRARRIRIHDRDVGRAIAGQRCALNLVGIDAKAAVRGNWVLAEAIHRPTTSIASRISVLSSESKALSHWTPVHVHLGTASATGHVAISRGMTIAPGMIEIAQLVLDQTIGALHGDRFILRDASGRRTLGGGLVLDPFANGNRREDPARQARVKALDHPTPAMALSALIESTGGYVDLARFETAFNLTPNAVSRIVAEAGVIQLGKGSHIGIAEGRYSGIRASVVDTLKQYHRTNPRSVGQEVATIHRVIAPELPISAFELLLRDLAKENRVSIQGSKARLPGHNPTDNSVDRILWARLVPKLAKAGFATPTSGELASRLGLEPGMLNDFFHRKARSGVVVKVGVDRFYLRTTMARLADVAKLTAKSYQDGKFTAAQYRDATGLSRGLAIEILECLDRLGITQRIGDVRRIASDYVPILGHGNSPQVRARINWRVPNRFRKEAGSQ